MKPAEYLPRLRGKRKRIKRIGILPTLITLANGFCGFLAIAKVADALYGSQASFELKLLEAGWLILLAMVFDSLDGKIARVTKTTTRFGSELDSLCDAVTFGVAPAFLVKVLVERTPIEGLHQLHPRLMLFLSSLYVLCAILRLARYNVETLPEDTAHNYFKGLPSPAAAGVLATWAIVYADKDVTVQLQALHISKLWMAQILPFLAPALGLLMISRIGYIHLVNKMFKGRRSFFYLVQLVFVGILALLYKEIILSIGFLVYVLSGPIIYLLEKVFGLKIIPRRPVVLSNEKPTESMSPPPSGQERPSP